MIGSLGLRDVGWRTIVVRTVTEFIEDELPTYASALAFQMFFSLFPFLLLLIAVIGFLELPEFFDWLQAQATLVLPSAAMDLVLPAIEQLQTQKPGLFSIGAVVALWSSSSAIRSSMDAMNRAYDVQEGRPTWKRIPLSVLYTVGVAAFLLAAAGLMVTGPQVMNWLAGQLGIEDAVVVLWNWLRIPAAVLLLMMVVAAVYYLLPDVEQEFRFITPARCWRCWCGWWRPWASVTTRRTSPTTTPCTAASARSSSCCCTCTSPPPCCCSAPSSTR